MLPKKGTPVMDQVRVAGQAAGVPSGQRPTPRLPPQCCKHAQRTLCKDPAAPCQQSKHHSSAPYHTPKHAQVAKLLTRPLFDRVRKQYGDNDELLKQ